MKITLCIETSGPHCSLALAAGEQIFHRAEPLQRRHNERVLPLIQALYQEAGVSLEATELVGFGAGPGSFTGVRIAASIAQGLALATNSRVVPMPGSEILLASARRQYSGPQKMGWLVSIPSRADAYYLSFYRQRGDEVVCETSDVLVTSAPAWLAEQAKAYDQTMLIGERPDWLDTTEQIRALGPIAPSAAAMIHIARSRAPLPAEEALPIYLQGDSPWQPMVR